MPLETEIRACRICSERFSATHTSHVPHPIVWFTSTARILIAGQAPGMRVYESGRPFTDPSGDRLREWLGVAETQFYDKELFAIVPMAFCFPGYNARGADLPPPKICGQTWHHKVMDALPNVRLRVIVGAAAHRYHLGTNNSVTQVVQSWKDYGPNTFVLPHPSWRNTAWLKKNPWFGEDVLPALQARVQEVLND